MSRACATVAPSRLNPEIEPRAEREPKRSTRPNGDMFGRVWGSARGWKGGGRADLALGTLERCVRLLVAPGRRLVQRNRRTFFRAPNQRLKLAQRVRGGSGNGDSGGDRGGAHRPCLGHGVRA